MLHSVDTFDTSSITRLLSAGVSSSTLPPSTNIFPSASYDVPVNCNSSNPPLLLLVNTYSTDIIFVVSVPVLSEQITLVHPNVSTLGSVRTIAFFFAIFCVPNARHVVITTDNPSGIAATANATAILK